MSVINPILLAEDLEDDVVAMRRVLKKAGVLNPIVVVQDGEEAVRYLKAEGRYADREKYPFPHVLFLDIKMPKMDGFAVLEWCRTQDHLKAMLIVVLTAALEVNTMQRAYSLGADSFLVKPCHIEDITNLIKSFNGYWELAPADKTAG